MGSDAILMTVYHAETDSVSQFNKIASTKRYCSERLSLALLSATTLLKIESLFNEIDRCLYRPALPPSSKLSQSPSWTLIHNVRDVRFQVLWRAGKLQSVLNGLREKVRFGSSLLTSKTGLSGALWACPENRGYFRATRGVARRAEARIVNVTRIPCPHGGKSRRQR